MMHCCLILHVHAHENLHHAASVAASVHAEGDMRPSQHRAGQHLSAGAAGCALGPCDAALALAIDCCAAAAAVWVEVRVLPHMRSGSHNTAEQMQQTHPRVWAMG